MRVFSRHPTRYIPLTVCAFGGGTGSHADGVFLADRALCLLRYFELRVLSGSFSFLRGEFRVLAGRLLRQGRPVAALVAFSTYLWHRVRARITARRAGD